MNLTDFKKLVVGIQQKEVNELRKIVESYKDIIIIGNGGSNAIASHIANDYTKVLNKRCISFTDSSRLTCYMNDYGVENAYKQFVKEFADNKTLVILISSSGESENIYRTTKYCVTNEVPFILLTGFSPNNKSRSAFSKDALMDIWIDSTSYACVECMHKIYLHSIVDI